MSATLSHRSNRGSNHFATVSSQHQHLDKDKLSQLDKLSQTFKLVTIGDGDTTVSLKSTRSHLKSRRSDVQQ